MSSGFPKKNQRDRRDSTAPSLSLAKTNCQVAPPLPELAFIFDHVRYWGPLHKPSWVQVTFVSSPPRTAFTSSHSTGCPVTSLYSRMNVLGTYICLFCLFPSKSFSHSCYVPWIVKTSFYIVQCLDFCGRKTAY